MCIAPSTDPNLTGRQRVAQMLFSGFSSTFAAAKELQKQKLASFGSTATTMPQRSSAPTFGNTSR